MHSNYAANHELHMHALASIGIKFYGPSLAFSLYTYHTQGIPILQILTGSSKMGRRPTSSEQNIIHYKTVIFFTTHTLIHLIHKLRSHLLSYAGYYFRFSMQAKNYTRTGKRRRRDR